mmetsp:Transcript_23386/g.39951  ORF Transcript_23386/g.39951 Transcript_23386/m.39951 type:complete len:249 (-) Transcript_23386:78-824(-)
MQLHKRFRDCDAHLRLKREALARPVARRTKPPYLVGDETAVLGLPLPHALEKLFAPERLAGAALLLEGALDEHLSRNPRVVGARQPQRRLPTHPREPRHDVLQRHKHGVPHVQLACDIRRWHRDHEALLLRVFDGLEEARLLPPRVQSLLDLARVVLLRHLALDAGRCRCGAIDRLHGRCAGAAGRRAREQPARATPVVAQHVHLLPARGRTLPRSTGAACCVGATEETVHGRRGRKPRGVAARGRDK